MEKHIFAKIEPQLNAMYCVRNLKTELNFLQKKETIISKYTLREMLNDLCLHEKFWSIDQAQLDKILPPK